MLEGIGTNTASKTVRTEIVSACIQPPSGALRRNSINALTSEAFAAASLQSTGRKHISFDRFNSKIYDPQITVGRRPLAG